VTFILGLCYFDSSPVSERLLEPMMAAQQELAPDGLKVRKTEGAAFARGLYRQSAEDEHDAQPEYSAARRTLIAADARIDNRAELLDRLHLARLERISDSDLLARTYHQFGLRSSDLVVGDFAFAAWDESERRLTLARDYTGQRPLHYHLGDGFVAFSSLPHGLLALDGVSAEPDPRQLAEFFADIPRSGDRTYFKHIKRVEPGHVVLIDRRGVTKRAYWRPPDSRIQFANDADYSEALRESLDRATSARLRGAHMLVGTHLSAGLDSGAVSTSAATLMREKQGRVIAFTSAPREGFDGPVPRGRVADEVEIAAEVARLHPNIDHVVVRAEGQSPLDILRRDSGLYGEPLGLPCNQVWWAAVHDAARERGVRVMLTGESGNLAFSSGGLPTLSELVADGAWLRLWSEARQLKRKGVRWRGIAGSAFGPWIPNWLWAAAQRLSWGKAMGSVGEALLLPLARRELPRRTSSQSRSRRPEVNARQARGRFLQSVDPGAFRKATLARWGVEERDPTTDRRLVEYCLAVPPEQLVRNGVTRALARRALADRLPEAVLDAPRGYQGADWYERVDGVAIAQSLEELGLKLNSEAGIDMEAIRILASAWPVGGWSDGSIISTYRYGLLRAVSAAYFLASFHRDRRERRLRPPDGLTRGEI
jgi:asparagine synthase (glutamine-hydrolysing)